MDDAVDALDVYEADAGARPTATSHKKRPTKTGSLVVNARRVTGLRNSSPEYRIAH